MNEITLNSAFEFTKEDLYTHGVSYLLDPVLNSMSILLEPKFVKLINENLKETENAYQFILTVKKLDSV